MSTNANVESDAPESAIARDLVRRALYVAPAFLLMGLLGWGTTGLFSAALSLALVADRKSVV